MDLISLPEPKTAKQRDCPHDVSRCFEGYLTCNECGYKQIMPMNLHYKEWNRRSAKWNKEMQTMPTFGSDNNPLYVPIEKP